ncbi:hypothetical protein AIOL_001910 [Candidatus Rhodobacter oscarellae]|uniref:Uncharacterized protein n=2 Tax=Candidatus Rhodobacter oscarellae TaxID=1675527 RepID=A0A0J9E2M8_9RHOB|nr:hypothetical protein AIOL_001910 [Candidatus Rhodobacter lobularis]
MSKRKPLNDTAGYVASLKTPFGYVMITDRDKGGDWIDSEERWVVSAFDHQLANLALIEASSLRRAREIMKDARRDGFATDWIDFSEAA